MPNDCVNRSTQSNGDHEVHDLSSTHGCLPAPVNRVDLGYHASCVGAVAAAKLKFPQSNGCFWCARACNTG